MDCGVDTAAIDEYYHVWEDVWFAALGVEWHGPPVFNACRDHINWSLWPNVEIPWSAIEAGYLCLGCLETRLGRKLDRSDFSDAPVNTGYEPRSERMLDRIQRLPRAHAPARGASAYDDSLAT